MQRRNVKFILKTCIVSLFLITIIGYSYSKSRNLINGPQIVINSPSNGTTASTSTMEINGVASNIVAININDRPIFIDEQGVFNEIALLNEGYNVVKISAKDKFGRETQKILEIVYTKNI